MELVFSLFGKEKLNFFLLSQELLTPFRFEQFLDQLERNSGNQVI